PSYAFADYDLAREILHTQNHVCTYIMVGLAPGADPVRVKAALVRNFPDQLVLTRGEYSWRTVVQVLNQSGIGQMIGIGTVTSIFVGFIIVALTMLSAVLDHLREFGTLKAI